MALQGAAKRKIQRGVDEREPFRIGNVSGHKLTSDAGMGQLSTVYRCAFVAAMRCQEGYAVYSYETPIAWYAGGRWTVPDVKYSRTTTNHQNVVRTAIGNPAFYAGARW